MAGRVCSGDLSLIDCGCLLIDSCLVCLCAHQILRAEKFSRLYRGMGAVIVGAVPSHAVSFSTYEFVKQSLGGNKEGHHPFLNGIAGTQFKHRRTSRTLAVHSRTAHPSFSLYTLNTFTTHVACQFFDTFS